LDLRERERGAQDWILGRVFLFLSGQRTKGVGGGLFLVPTKIEPLGEGFSRLVWCDIGQVRWNPLESGEVGLVWSTGQVWWRDQTSPVEAGKMSLEAGPRPNKSGGAL
jgi:hypothetical protein